MNAAPPPIGVVLAAGRGRRLGLGPKAWVRAQGETLLARACRILRAGGVGTIVAVLPPDLPHGPVPEGVACALNLDPDSGPLGSLRAALDLSGVSGPVVVYPVDHPDVTAEVVESLREALADAGDETARVVPTWDGRRGHPVALTAAGARAVAAADDQATPRPTLRTVLAAAGAVVEVPVDCPGVLRNLNQPGD